MLNKHKKHFSASLCLCIFALTLLPLVNATLAQGDFPRTLTDGTGTEVTIDAPPQRIVSLTVASDEVLFSLVDPARLAAVTDFGRDPGISNVAVQSSQIDNTIVSADDTEQIIGLEPDIVFAAAFTQPEVVTQLRDAGLTVFVTETPTSFDAIRANIRLIGEVVGEEEKAEALVAEMDSVLSEVAFALDNPTDKPRVLYLTPGNYTSGVESSISEVINAAGGIDVAAAAGIEQAVPVSDEFIIEQDPDVILLSGWTPYDPTFVETFQDNPAFAGLDALRNGKVYVANDAHLSAVSQYIAEAVKDVAAYLYPDMYPVYPVRLMDASGEIVSVPVMPRTVIIGTESAAIQSVIATLRSRPFDLIFTDPEDSFVGGDAPTIFFAAPPRDEVPQVSADATYVRIYGGDSLAEQVANVLIVGTALGDRVAALNAAQALSREAWAVAE